VMLKMLNAGLTHCEECANYGTYVDSPVAYMHLCRWSAMSTRVKTKFVLLLRTFLATWTPLGSIKLV